MRLFQESESRYMKKHVEWLRTFFMLHTFVPRVNTLLWNHSWIVGNGVQKLVGVRDYNLNGQFFTIVKLYLTSGEGGR